MTKWGFSAESFDVSSRLALITQDPTCGYPITFEAYCHDEIAANIPIDEVTEIAFYPFAKVFSYEKCGPTSDPLDPECAGTPYTKVINVRVIARAGLTQFAETTIDFTITFVPDCTKDTLYFNIPADFGVILYDIYSPGQPRTLAPIYTQSIPECEVECGVFENLSEWNASPMSII